MQISNAYNTVHELMKTSGLMTHEIQAVTWGDSKRVVMAMCGWPQGRERDA